MHFCRSVVLDMSLDLKSKSASPSGNRTPVSRVTGGDTYHYTNEDLLPSTDLAQNLVLNIQQFSGLSDAKKFQGAAQVCFKLGSPTIMATHWDKNRHKAHILGMLSLWRNRLARSAVNRKVGGSSPPRDGCFCKENPIHRQVTHCHEKKTLQNPHLCSKYVLNHGHFSSSGVFDMSLERLVVRAHPGTGDRRFYEENPIRRPVTHCRKKKKKGRNRTFCT